MPFVKLDCGILDSTLWADRDAREIFITALLMAEPFEVTDPLPQIEAGELALTGWSVPPGWYGFVAAAGPGISRRAGLEYDIGTKALKRLGSPEDSSRSPEFDGRRLVRVNGGFIVLNFMKYRERDYTGAQRQAKFRQRIKENRNGVTVLRNGVTGVTLRNEVTHTEAEAEAEAEKEEKKNTNTCASAHDAPASPEKDNSLFEAWWKKYPRKRGKGAAVKAWWNRVKEGHAEKDFEDALKNYIEEIRILNHDDAHIMHGSTFLGLDKGFLDFMPGTWTAPKAGGNGKAKPVQESFHNLTAEEAQREADSFNSIRRAPSAEVRRE